MRELFKAKAREAGIIIDDDRQVMHIRTEHFEKNSEIALNILFHDLSLHLEIEDFRAFHEEYKEHNTILWKLYGAGNMLLYIKKIIILLT